MQPPFNNGIGLGSPVRRASNSVSMQGGVATAITTTLKGRVCKMTGNGTCRVQFEQIGCRIVHVSNLILAAEPAPHCTADCRGTIA